jgi:AcrR family transcriptional regulator
MRAVAVKGASSATQVRAEAKRRTRENMQAKALELFRRQGYENVTSQEIAQACGLTERTFFRHFATKDGVVLWYVDDDDPPVLSAADTARGIRAVAETQARWLSQGEAQRRLLLARTQLIVSTPALRAQWLDKNQRRAILVADQVHDLNGGELLDVRAIASAVFASACIAAELWATAGGHEPLDDVLDRAFAALRSRAGTRR